MAHTIRHRLMQTAIHTRRMRRHVLCAAMLLLLTCCMHDKARQHYEAAMRMAGDGDSPQALASLLKAAECRPSGELAASIYSDMGHILFDEGLQEQALPCFMRAYEADSLLADTARMAYDLCDIGNVWRTRENDDSCMLFFDRAHRMALCIADSLLTLDIESQMAGYHLMHHQYEEARRLLQPTLGEDPEKCDLGILFMRADLYMHTGQESTADSCCRILADRGDTGQRQMAHKWMAEMLLGKGSFEEAHKHLVRYEELTDTLMEETDTEAMRRIKALYDYTLRERQNAALQRRYIIAVSAFLMTACLLALFILHYRQRRLQYRLKVQRLEQLLSEYRNRSEESLNRQKEILANTPIFHHITRLLSDQMPKAMTDEDFHILEDTLEKTHPGFVGQLRSFHQFSPHEWRLSLLLKAGVSPINIARLTAHSKQSVSSSRARLYTKVFGKKGSPNQWDEFIQSL